MTTLATQRPVTSKARGVCRYYNTERGCFAGPSCKFTHGVPAPEQLPPLLTPYDQSKLCKFYAGGMCWLILASTNWAYMYLGFCKRGATCWFRHVVDKQPTIDEEQDEDLCSICFEKPATFGLLGEHNCQYARLQLIYCTAGCSHIFCLQVCNRNFVHLNWRNISF